MVIKVAIIGDNNELKVLRKTDIGYMLDSEIGEIFLHNNETMFTELKADDLVTVFLYFDNKKRLSATMHKPLVTINQAALLNVVSVNNDLGVFLDMGINKDLLLSKDDLPYDKNLWPRVNDKVYVKVINKNRLIAKITDPEITLNSNYEIGKTINGYIIRIGEVGINVVTEDLVAIFVHNSMYRGNYRIGDLVELRITHFSDKGYSGSLLAQKENLRIDDATMILEYLKTYKTLPLTSKSSAEEIHKYFEMSRKAFKRALGYLYREKLVKFSETNTYLEGEENGR